MTKNLTTPVRQIVALLVTKDYDQIVRLTGGQRLDAAAIESAIRDYGRTIVLPPDTAIHNLDVVCVQNAHPPRWSVRMPLWTAEEGRSDLSVELTIIEDGGGYVVELDDIHVL
jgi:hypothetical protein